MARIIVVGRVKEKFLREGISEYVKRLSVFEKISFVWIKDSTVEDEGRRILKAAGDDYVVALAAGGKLLASMEFAEFVKKNQDKKISYVIGGPCGLSGEVLDCADFCLSLSKMTFTHEMACLFLAEQLYRAHMINAGRSYHR